MKKNIAFIILGMLLKANLCFTQIIDNLDYNLCRSGFTDYKQCKSDYNRLFYVHTLINTETETILEAFVQQNTSITIHPPNSIDALKIRVNNTDYIIKKGYYFGRHSYEGNNYYIPIEFGESYQTGEIDGGRNDYKVISYLKLVFEKIPSTTEIFDLIEGQNYTSTKGWWTINNFKIDTTMAVALNNLYQNTSFGKITNSTYSEIFKTYGKTRFYNYLKNTIENEPCGFGCSGLRNATKIVKEKFPEKMSSIEELYINRINTVLKNDGTSKSYWNTLEICELYDLNFPNSKNNKKVKELIAKLKNQEPVISKDFVIFENKSSNEKGTSSKIKIESYRIVSSTNAKINITTTEANSTFISLSVKSRGNEQEMEKNYYSSYTTRTGNIKKFNNAVSDNFISIDSRYFPITIYVTYKGDNEKIISTTVRITDPKLNYEIEVLPK